MAATLSLRVYSRPLKPSCCLLPCAAGHVQGQLRQHKSIMPATAAAGEGGLAEQQAGAAAVGSLSPRGGHHRVWFSPPPGDNKEGSQVVVQHVPGVCVCVCYDSPGLWLDLVHSSPGGLRHLTWCRCGCGPAGAGQPAAGAVWVYSGWSCQRWHVVPASVMHHPAGRHLLSTGDTVDLAVPYVGRLSQR